MDLTGGIQGSEQYLIQEADIPDDYVNIISEQEFLMGMYWMVKDDGKIIGTIGVHPENDDEYKLSGFCVDENYRGRGIGKNLLQQALQFTEGKRVYLWTLRHYHDKAITMYERNEFKLEQEVKTKFFIVCKFGKSI